MLYHSTRCASSVPFSQTLFSGPAPDGGLYVPATWPDLSCADVEACRGISYADLATRVLAPFLGEGLDPATLKALCQATYAPEVFRHPNVAPLRQIADDFYLLELFYGPTLLFKDYALQFLARLFDHFLTAQQRRITILLATSGDTGSAAIEAFKNIRNARIFVLHPAGRPSEIQRRQMTTVQAPNVFNLAVDGSFDACQALVKTLFSDAALVSDLNLTAVNSINWARIAAQVVYYVSAARVLGAPQKSVSFAVPTGNFGNVFAGYVARHIGVPIETLVIGTNRNDALTRFFETGVLSSDKVVPSLSPSMDIQVPSNFERYLYDLLRGDTARLSALMTDFQKTRCLALSIEEIERARREFFAARCSDAQTVERISEVYKTSGTLIDPHTAVGVFAAQQHRARTGGKGPLVALACAHPAKFPDTVEKATGVRPPLPEFLSDLPRRAERFVPVRDDLTIVRNYILSHAVA